MQAMIGARQIGKTEACVGWARLSGGVIITHCEQEADRLRRTYKLRPDQVLCAGRTDERGVRSRSAVVDNLDLVLPRLIGFDVDGFTMTGTQDWNL